MPADLLNGLDRGVEGRMVAGVGRRDQNLLDGRVDAVKVRAFAQIGYSLSPMAVRSPAHALNPRKTPSQARSAATVAAVLEAAARILETDGFEGYTTNAVARRAGVSIGSLYQYFPSKDAITKALMARETAALLAEVAAIDPDRDGKAGLRRLIEAAVAQQMRRPALARLLDFEEARLPVDEEKRSVGEQVTRVMRRCLEAPGLADAARGASAADDLLAVMRGLVDAAGERGERDHAALAARVSRAVFGYLEHPF